MSTEKFENNVIDAFDLFTKIKSENTFLAELKERLEDANFELTDEDSKTLEEIRAKYNPQMVNLLELGKLDEYNKIAELLILPTIFQAKNEKE